MTVAVVYVKTLNGVVALARAQPIDPDTQAPALDQLGRPILADWSQDPVVGAAAGTPLDAPWSGVGSTSIIGALKAIWNALTGVVRTQAAATALTNSSGIITTSASPGSALIVVPYSATRKFVHVYSRTTGSETIDLGSSNVVPGGGIPVTGGSGFSFMGSGAAGPIYAVTTAANSPMSYVEG